MQFVILFSETWFRINDAQMSIPPKSHQPCFYVYVFIFASSYSDIGGYDIRVGPLAFNKMYTSFLHAHELIATPGECAKIWSTVIGAVAFSEALRFPYLRIWVYKTLLGAMRYPLLLERTVPERLT